jgi:hypothetical protein
MEKPTKQQLQVLAAGAAIAVAGYGVYSYMAQDKDGGAGEGGTEQPATEAELAEGRSPALRKQVSERFEFFTDAGYDKPHSLKKEEADKRSGQVSNVSYKTAYALLRGGDNFHG